MDRRSLTDTQWAKMQPHCRGKVTAPGRTGGDGRLFLEAVLWIARTGSPWRDLRRRSASGTRCSNGTGTGLKLMFSNAFSTHVNFRAKLTRVFH